MCSVHRFIIRAGKGSLSHSKAKCLLSGASIPFRSFELTSFNFPCKNESVLDFTSLNGHLGEKFWPFAVYKVMGEKHL
jgi:hypothetical protein